MKSNFNKLLLLVVFNSFFFNNISAQGDLLIFPKRIVFEGKKKVEQIILSNIGKDSAIYNISFIEYKMNEFGQFNTIIEPDNGQQFASPYLRVYPRKVYLAPNESQTVKLQITDANKLVDGEYRSHLYFRAEKNSKPLGKEKEKTDSTTVSVKLETIFGISIPAIINKGLSTTIVSISQLKYSIEDNNGHFLYFSLNRKGNMSIYGDVHIYYVSNENISYEVGKASGLAVYAPGTIRNVKMQLQKPVGVNFSGGKFKVVLTKNESNDVIAEGAHKI